jgi:hypothetical protein
LKRGSKRIEFFREHELENEMATAQEIKFAQRSFGKELLVYIPSEKSAVVRIAGITADVSSLLVFWWHRNWLLWPNLPLCARVSAHRAEQINGDRPAFQG